MRERERLLWGVFIILLLIIVGYMGYNVYHMGRQVRQYQEAMIAEAMGSKDPQLRAAIEELEDDLRERMAYKFDVKEDPLELSKVVQGQKFLAQLGLIESFEASNKMRLSCTIISEEPAAVIKFRGRSRILRVGDKINEYNITRIEPRKVTLKNASETIELITEKSQESLDRDRDLIQGSVTVDVAADSAPPSGNY